MVNNTITTMAGTGTRGVGLLATGGEIVLMISESKYAILLLILLICADFRYGWGESNKRYLLAKAVGDKRRMDLHRWRTSRALRRSFNKLADYIIIMAVGMAIGMALLEPIGISHIFGAYGACLALSVCEIISVLGHFFYLHGVRVEKKTVVGFIKAFVIALAKRKSQDVGEALEEACNKEGGEQ